MRQPALQRLLRTPRLLSLALGGLALALAACGAPTAEEPQVSAGASDEQNAPSEPNGASSEQPDASGPTVESVLSEVEGLEGEERRERLAELAAEAGAVNLYTSNLDAAELAATFTDDYGVEVSVYRATGDVVLQRLIQEADAGFQGADVVEMDMLRMVALDQDQGLLAPYDGPALEGLPELALFPGWTATRYNVFVTGQNTDVIPLEQRPTSYEDLADPAFAGLMMMEPRAAEWFVTLYQHFEDQGMEPQAIEDMFTQMAGNATVISGNSVQAELLAAGEYGLAASTYSHLIDDLSAAGAPVVWQPPIEPTVVRPNGSGIVQDAANPAGAILLHEWFLTDAQQLIAEVGRVPARPEAQAGILDGVETINVAAEAMIEDGERWEQLYEEILRAAEPEPGQ